MSGYRKGRRHYRYGQPRKHDAGKGPLTLTCPDCGKLCYETRQQARQAGRHLYPDTTIRAYRCGQWFHYTSQPTARVTRYRQHAAA